MTASPSPPPPPSHPPRRMFSTLDVASLFSAALGLEKAVSVVITAFTDLGLPNQPVDGVTVKRVLDHLAGQGGLVGITGRVALSRFDVGRNSSGSMRSVSAATPRRSLDIVITHLTATLGAERATTLVRENADAMGLKGDVELEQALALLERITRMGGVIGVAARFAKTRIHLSW